MTRKIRKTFSSEFKKEAVRLLEKGDKAAQPHPSEASCLKQWPPRGCIPRFLIPTLRRGNAYGARECVQCL